MDDYSHQLTILEKCKTRLKPLHTQIDDDYSLIRGDPFDGMPKDSGVWQKMTVNDPGVLVDSYVRTLTEGKMKLGIKPSSIEPGVRKGNIRSLTEQFVLGTIWQADQIRMAVPSEKSLLASVASDAVETGGSIVVVYLEERLEGGEWKLIPKIHTYYPRQSFWLEGTKGIIWFNNIVYGNKSQLEEEYEDDIEGAEDKDGKVEVWDIWTPDEFQAYSGGKPLGELVKHDLGYIPIHIATAGSRPYRQSTQFPDAFKDSWQAAIAHNRALYADQNYLCTLIKTQAAAQAKPTFENRFDTSKNANAKPVELDSVDPGSPGGEIPVDIGKGQGIGVISLTTPLPLVFQALEIVMQKLSLGGLVIDYLKLASTAQTASGQAQYFEAARQALNPYKQNMVEQYEWTGEQIARQYKHGKFKETHIEGYDANGKSFEVTIAPSQISNQEHFTADLKLDMLRDKMGQVAYLKELVSIGGISPRGILEELWDDPELVQEQIDEAMVSKVLGMPFRRVRQALMRDRTGKLNDAEIEENREAILLITRYLDSLAAPLGDAPPPVPALPAAPSPALLGMGADGTGLPPPITAQAGQEAAAPMTDVARAARLGLTVARR